MAALRLGLLVAALVAAPSSLARAQQFGPGAFPPTGPAPPANRPSTRPDPSAASPDETPGLLGDALHGREPITAEYLYTGDLFTNTRGGLNTTRAVRYRGLLDLLVQADLDAMSLFPGGRFVVFAQNGHGQGPTYRDVGDVQFISNLEAPDFMQVSEYRWEKTLVDDTLDVLLGKQDVNTDFASIELAQRFIHSSFGFHPTIPMPTFPNPSMAGVVLWQVREGVHLQGGVWDGRPDGRKWGFSSSGEIFSIVELELRYALADDALPGEIHAGAWYDSGRWDSPTSPVEETLPGQMSYIRPPRSLDRRAGPLSAPTQTYAGNYGFHAEWQQALFREANTAPEDTQGLGCFLQYGWSPEDRNVPHEYLGAGLVYQGLFPGRDEDVVGLGVAHLIFTNQLPNPPETAVELFYQAALSPHVMLQPDLQYVAHPFFSPRDALAFGLRMELEF